MIHNTRERTGRMRLAHKKFWITKNTFHILPALLVRFDDIMYSPPNVAISFHWLWFNGWVMWQK